MKIAVAVTRFPPAAGGAEKYVERIAVGLAAKGHDVKVYTSDYEQQLRFIKLPPSVPRRENWNGVEVFRERSYPWKRYGYFVTPSIAPKIAAFNPDVVYGMGFGYWPTFAARLAALLRRARFILQPNFQPPGSPFTKAYTKALGPIISRAAGAIFYSKYELDLYERYFPAPKKRLMAYPGVDDIFLDANNLNVLRELGLSGKKVILSVGRVDAGKRLDLVVKAAPSILEAIPDAAFVFAGPDFGETEKLKELASSSGVADKIVFTGALPSEKLASLYREATALAHPSGFELFGVAVAEAFTSRLPVVAASAGSLPELVEHEKTGLLFAPGDHAALAAAVKRIVADDKLRYEIVENAAQKARERYDWEKTIASVEAFFREIAG